MGTHKTGDINDDGIETVTLPTTTTGMTTKKDNTKKQLNPYLDVRPGGQDLSQKSMGIRVTDMRKQKDAVCKIMYIDERNSCASGFLAKSGDFIGIMTNHHVIRTVAQSTNRLALFYYQEKRGGLSSPIVVRSKPDIFFWTNSDLDVSFVACQHALPLKQGICPIDLNNHVADLE